MAKRKLEVEIVGDASSLKKAFGQAGDSGSKLGNALRSASKVGLVALGGLGVGAVAAGKQMIGMASDAAEVQSKMDVVFGKALPTLTKEIDKFSQATGTSKFAMREQAADMGALLAPMLGSKQGAADMSLQFVKLATDLGSFNNIPTADALEKIRAGLVGEAEPLRSLGVLLTEASTKEWAYTHGIAARGKELTEVQKVEARAGQIMAQTALAQGDATRTAGSMANQLKTLKSNISDAATELGMALIPAALSVVSTFNDHWPKIRSVAATVFDALKTGVSTLISFFRTNWDTITEIARSALDKLKVAMEAVQKVAAIVWPKVTALAKETAEWYRDHLEPTITSVSKNIALAWDKMGRDMAGTTEKNTGTGSSGAAGILKTRLAGMVALTNTLLAVLRGDWSEAWAQLKDAVRLNMEATWGIIRSIWGKIFEFVATIPGRMKGVFEGAHRLLYSEGAAILQGLWDGLKAKWDAVADWVGGLGDKIKALKGPEAKDAKLLEPEGKAIILGLETGMMASWSTLAPKINALGGNIIENFILGISAKQPQFTGKLAQAAQQALEAAKAKVESYQGVLGDAFGKLGDYVKRVFDAKTQNLLDNVSRKFDAQIAKWQNYAQALTPAEKALAAIDAQEEQRGRESALAAAQAALAKAEAMEAGLEREQAVAAAREQLRLAELANTRAALQAQAEVERAAREAEAAAHIAKLEATKARELQNLEERRRQLGEQLDQQLATLQERLAKHPEEHDKIQKRIQALLKSYGVPMQKSGELLGKAFARGIRDSFDDVERAARKLAEIVAKYVPHSPAEKGPLSRPIDWQGYLTDGLPRAWSGVGAAMSAGGAVVPGGGFRTGAAGGRPMVVNINVNGTTIGDVPRRVGEQIYSILVDVDRSSGGRLFNNSAPVLT